MNEPSDSVVLSTEPHGFRGQNKRQRQNSVQVKAPTGVSPQAERSSAASAAPTLLPGRDPRRPYHLRVEGQPQWAAQSSGFPGAQRQAPPHRLSTNSRLPWQPGRAAQATTPPPRVKPFASGTFTGGDGHTGI